MTENNANENKTPELNVDGVVYSPELKKGYDKAFLTRVEIGDRKGIQCTAALSHQLKRIVNILGYGRTTLGSYVQNILECHLEMHKVVINELKAASLLSDTDDTAMDMRDVEFDKTKEEKAKEEKPEQREEPKDDKRMTAEQESRAWEDLRDEEDKLDKENNDPVPPNPLASGEDFEQITAATDTLEHPENHTVHEFTIAVKVIHGLNGTEFTGCLPDSLFERLQQFHKMADRRAVEETENSEKVEAVSKPTESRAEKETDAKETKVSTESNRRDLNEAMALINEIRECSQKFRNQ